MNRTPISATDTKAVVKALLDWFALNQRDLPWRHTQDPYAIWVSEIMLQQTQVKTVIPYYERWLKALPTLHDLAMAPESTILKLWEGLGYYTRVRNLQKGAQLIVEKYGGEFPKDFDLIQDLPGIGRYTAGAIASIAFNTPRPILDGNVIRVLTRLHAIKSNVASVKTRETLWGIAGSLVHEAAEHDNHAAPCSSLNQALMELGALICVPRGPACMLCPLQMHCEAYASGLADSLPRQNARPVATPRRFVACVLEVDGLYLVEKRAEGGVNAGLWEFPNVELTDLEESSAPLAAAVELTGIAAAAWTPLLTVRHSITRYRITQEVLITQPPKRVAPWCPKGKWFDLASLKTLPFSSAHKRIIRKLAKE